MLGLVDSQTMSGKSHIAFPCHPPLVSCLLNRIIPSMPFFAEDSDNWVFIDPMGYFCSCYGSLMKIRDDFCLEWLCQGWVGWWSYLSYVFVKANPNGLFDGLPHELVLPITCTKPRMASLIISVNSVFAVYTGIPVMYSATLNSSSMSSVQNWDGFWNWFWF